MSLAVHADSGRDFWSAPSSSAPLKKKLLLASVAMTGASVIAVTPVASNLPALEIAQQRAVELAAFENPFAVLGGTLSTTFKNLSNRGGEINANLIPSLSAILGNKELQRELSVILFRPQDIAQQLQDRLAEHQATLQSGQEQALAGWLAHNELLPAVLDRAQAELQAGHFTEAFAHLNDWFIFGLGAAGWPLYPSFAVPGQVARDVGGPAIAAILDALLVGDTTLAGYPHAILVPFVSAIFRFTDSLDEVRAASVAGDAVTALSHLVNMPAKVLGAFLNGYSPSIAEDWNVFPGFLTAGGPIDAFLVQYPKLIAKALGLISVPAATETTEDALSKVSSTALVAEGDVVTLSLETGALPVDAVSATTEEATAEETVTEVPVEETVAEVPVEEEETVTEVPVEETVTEETVTEETVTEETVTEETAPVTEADATESETESAKDAKDAKDAEKAEAKDAEKAEKAEAKTEKAEKADATADKAEKSDSKSDTSDSGSSSE